jgi:hypothetical protein
LLGSELVTNGTFDTNLANWSVNGTPVFTWSSGGASLTRNAFGDLAYQAITCVVGRTYKVTATVVSGTIARIGFNSALLGGASEVLNNGGAGTYSAFVTATATTMYVILTTAGNASTAVFDNVTVKEYLGTTATGAAPKGLLIEEQRTNLVTYSAQFDDAAWTKSNASVTVNAIVSPDGTVNADKLVENTATSTHLLFPNVAITLATGVPYAYSVYAKAAERSICRLTNNDLLGVFFDLSAGTVTSVDAGFTGSITSVGNGWYRLVAVQASNSNVSGRLAVALVSTGTTTFYTGNGTSGLYIWGAQLE